MAANQQLFEVDYYMHERIYTITATESTHEALNGEEAVEQYIRLNPDFVKVSGPVNLTVQQTKAAPEVGTSPAPAQTVGHNPYGRKNLPEQAVTENWTEDDNKARQFVWDSKSTKLLLDEYGKRMHQFKDPKCKKRSVWAEIKEAFQQKGYPQACEDSLDRKLRNLKHHYKAIKDNNKKTSTGRGRVSWEFFGLMEELFVEDKTINFGKTVSAILPPKHPITNITQGKAEEDEKRDGNESPIDGTTIGDTHQAGPSQTPIVGQGVSSKRKYPLESRKKAKAQEARGLYAMRQANLNLEERRVRALEEINGNLQTHNALLQRKVEVLEKLFELEKNKRENNS